MEEIRILIKEILQKNNLGIWENNVNLLFTILGALSALFGIIYKLLKKYREYENSQIGAKQIPYFTSQEIENSVRCFIETQCQSVSPSIASEPSQTFAFVPKEKIIPFFLKKAFKGKQGDFKYYILLADSGMGKTTFLINLLIKYVKKTSSLKRFLSLQEFKYDIKLIPLGMPNAFNEINNIVNKGTTILLLDAFDEDNFAALDYKKRLDEILNIIQPFKEVVITCRTQFFPTEEEEPHKTGIFKYGGEKGKHEFKKLYISPFDDNDIQVYLKKKYPVWKIAKRNKAKDIVQKSPNLMVRPMLLNYIDDFVNQDLIYTHAYQIYEVLIEKWIDREASRDIDPEKFKKELHRFSHEVAVDIYLNRFKRGGLFITLNEISVFAKMRNIDLDQIKMTSRSLLNRNSEGHFKFSHRSILEYFLALEVSKNSQFLSVFNFEGMENVRLFLLELGTHKYIRTFYTKNRNFSIHYCTSEGFIGIINPNLISAKEIQNIFFIHFNHEYLMCEGIDNVILSFQSLRIFTSEKKDIASYSYRYKELLKKQSGLDKQLNSANLSESKIASLASDKFDVKDSINDFENKFKYFRMFEPLLASHLKASSSESVAK